MANTTIDRVSIEVEATAKGTSAVFSQIISQANTLKSVLSGLDVSKLSQVSKASNALKIDTSGMTKAEKDVSDTINSIKVKMAELNALKNAALSGDSSSMTSFERKTISIQSQIDGLTEKLRQLSDTRTGVSIDTDTFQTYRDELSQVQSDLTATKDQVASTVAAMNSSQPTIDTGETSSNLSEIADKAKAAASGLLQMTASGIKSGFSSLKSSLSKIKDTLSNIGTKSSNAVSTGFSKILKYGFGIRSLYVLFRRLRTAVKDSFTELQNSGAYYETTKANIDALKNSLSTLKYQFGAAFEPIFNTVAPALETLINYLVSVMNTISAFIAKLTGKSTYSKAVVATGEIASNTGSAASSASELNKQLQGFDELNNLSPDSGSSGGGGSGSSSDSSSVTYVEESVDSALSSFWDSLSDAITSGDWYQAGTLISEKLTEAMANIPWDDIFQSAANFGTDLANFLNGLITDDLFYQLGSTIANAIKTALIATLSFGTTFDWEGLGDAIASGIEGFVDENPLQLLAENFDVWANGILDALIEAVDKLKEDGTFDKIGEHIANAINTMDIPQKLWKLAKLAKSLLEGLASGIEECWDDLELQNKIGVAIVGMVAVAKMTGLSSTLATVLAAELMGKELTLQQTFSLKLAGLALTVASVFISDINLGSGGLQGLAEGALFNALGAVTLYAGLRMMGVSVGLSLKIALVKLAWDLGWTTGKWLSQEIAKKLSGTDGISAEAVDEYIEISQNMTLKGVITDVSEAAKTGNLWDAWCNMVNDWYQPIYDIIDGWIEKFEEQKDSVVNAIKFLKSDFVTAWKNAWGTGTSVAHGYNGATSEAVNYIEGTGQGLDSDMNEYGSNLWNGIVEGFKKAMLYTNPLLAPIALLKDKIAEWFKEKFGIESPAKKMYYYGEMIWRGIYEGFKEAMSNYSLSDLINELSLSLTGTGTEKTGLTAKGDFSSKSASDKTHSKTGKSGNGGGSSIKFDVTYNTKVTGAASSRQGLSDLKESFANLNTEASKSTEATYSAKTGGQLTDINTLDTWRQKVRNLISNWFGASATYRASVGGQMTSINDTDAWTERIQKFDRDWQEASSDASFNVNSNVSDADGQGGYLERLNKVKEEWKKNNPTATFTTTLAGSVTTTGGIDTLAGSFKTLKENYPSGSHSSSWSTSISGKSASDINTYASAAKNLYDSFYTGSHTGTWTITLNTSKNNVNDFINSIISKLNDKLNSTKVKGRALGGAYYGGSWHSIPQYAGGTLDAGSLFVAGEAGAELVGNINGRSEVLNRSQLASVMNVSFEHAMGQFGHRLLSASGIQYNTPSFNAYRASSEDNSYMMSQQNELLKEQNALLREIAQKDVSISSRDVFKATQSEANNYYNRTGNSPFLY